MTEQTPAPTEFQPIAAALAWAFPGAGYWYLGERLRGVYAMIGVMGLIVGGLLIGGIDSVDSKEDRYWSLVQFAAGPAVVALDRYHQGTLKPALRASRKQGSLAPPPYSKSVGRVNETGMLYIAMAGMMNIILVIDCATRARATGGGA